MREQLNNNPMAQLGMVAVLLVVGAFLFISMSGGGESESSESEAGVSSPATEGSLGTAAEGEAAAVAGSPVEAIPPPTVQPPAEVAKAWNPGPPVALLFVREGDIAQSLVRRPPAPLSGIPGVPPFVVPATQIA